MKNLLLALLLAPFLSFAGSAPSATTEAPVAPRGVVAPLPLLPQQSALVNAPIATEPATTLETPIASPATTLNQPVRNATLVAGHGGLASKGLQRVAKPSFMQRVAGKLINWLAKAMMGDDIVIALVLAILFFPFAVHRVYMGATPLLILGYLLLCFTGIGFLLLVVFDIVTFVTDYSRLGSDRLFSITD